MESSIAYIKCARRFVTLPYTPVLEPVYETKLYVVKKIFQSENANTQLKKLEFLELFVGIIIYHQKKTYVLLN